MANEEKLREYLRKVTAELHQAQQRLRDVASGCTSEPSGD
ncbi:polyketide synthase docking domain-containing protein, partial [Kibdelosporangium lantanae]